MRNLNLKKETLAELSDEELGDLVGASFRTKYDCTESHQVCNPLSRDVCMSGQTCTLLCPTEG
jgi:hypothetical protein